MLFRSAESASWLAVCSPAPAPAPAAAGFCAVGDAGAGPRVALELARGSAGADVREGELGSGAASDASNSRTPSASLSRRPLNIARRGPGLAGVAGWGWR